VVAHRRSVRRCAGRWCVARRAAVVVLGALVASSGMSTRLWTFGVEDCEGESVGGEAVEVAAMDASDEAVAA
jgi:hypothetical protein